MKAQYAKASMQEFMVTVYKQDASGCSIRNQYFTAECSVIWRRTGVPRSGCGWNGQVELGVIASCNGNGFKTEQYR